MTETIRFILIGKNGSGKSETGDTIINKKKSFTPSTPSCQLVCADRSGHELSVLNTPDFFQEPSEETNFMNLEIMKCLYMSAPGPHAIILVVPFGQLDEKYVEIMEKCIAVIDEKLFNFLIIVFTRSGYDIGEKHALITKANIDDYVKSLAEKVKTFVDKCHGVVGFDNSLDSENLEKMVEELVSLVPGISTDNPQFYTDGAFAIAETAVQFDTKEALEKMENEKKIKYQQEDSIDVMEDFGRNAKEYKEGELEENKEGPFKTLKSRNFAVPSFAHKRPNIPKTNANPKESDICQGHKLSTEQFLRAIRKQTQQTPKDMRTQMQMAQLIANYSSLALQIFGLVKMLPK